MGELINLRSARDGFSFVAYHAAAADARRGGLVLMQEIFGVTDHICGLADGFAADGYETIAPSLFERLHPGFAVGYEPEAVALGRDFSERTPWDQVEGDLAACIARLAAPVFAVG